MLLELLYTIAGFVLLVWGADRFVDGAAASARLLGVPPLLIGLTVVGFATSLPEVMVSVSAARSGLTGMAVGNAVGSNIANVGLVLAATVLTRPIQAELSGMLRREVPLLLLVSLATLLLFVNLRLDRIDGVLLLAGLTAFLGWTVHTARQAPPDDPVLSELTSELPPPMSGPKSAMLIALGLAVLLAGAELLVTGAELLARRFGLSDLVIGLTIVAIGTSLPELAVSVVSAWRGNPDIAVGNVVGSNMFNLLAVIGFAGITGPGPVDASVIQVHGPVMLLFSLVLLRLAYNLAGRAGLGRGAAALLLAGFVAYQFLLLRGGS